MKRSAWAGVWLTLMACPRLAVPDVTTVESTAQCPGKRRTDIVTTSGSSKVDVLVVVYNGAEMADVLRVLPDRLATLVTTLAVSALDFHLAVAPTLQGGLLATVPPHPQGLPARCPSCRFVSRADCATPSDCSNIPALMQRLLTLPAGIPPNPSPIANSVFQAARVALGVVPQCGEVVPHIDPPLENAGFYRSDANLLLISVGSGQDLVLQTPAAYQSALRTMRSLKGFGREDDVALVAISSTSTQQLRLIAGAVRGTDSLIQDPSGFCAEVRNESNACGAASLMELGAADFGLLQGCNHPTEDGGPGTLLTADPRIVQMACDSGGVVYDICARDWSSIITGQVKALLSNETPVRLSETPARPLVTDEGCPLGDGVCVEIRYNDGRAEILSPADVNISTANDTSVLQFKNVPPGVELHITYEVAATGARCCAGACDDGEFCNDEGFCQRSTCRGNLSCPTGALCDGVTGKCIPNTTCTRPEHCAIGSHCDCSARRCVTDLDECLRADDGGRP